MKTTREEKHENFVKSMTKQYEKVIENGMPPPDSLFIHPLDAQQSSIVHGTDYTLPSGYLKVVVDDREKYGVITFRKVY